MNQLFKSNRGRFRHIARDDAAHTLIALCGKSFGDFIVCGRGSATCPRCVSLDRPFEVPTTCRMGLISLSKGEAKPMAFNIMVRRCLADKDGTITERGKLILADIASPTCWPDEAGVLHARSALVRHCLTMCGQPLFGYHGMTYAQLAKLRLANAETEPGCMQCMARGA